MIVDDLEFKNRVTDFDGQSFLDFGDGVILEIQTDWLGVAFYKITTTSNNPIFYGICNGTRLISVEDVNLAIEKFMLLTGNFDPVQI